MSRLWSSLAQNAKPYIPGEQIDNQNIIKLNTNENPYPPAPKVVEAIQNYPIEKLRLYPSPTMDSLRTSIGKYYGVDKNNVFVGNGSDEVLAFSFMAFFEQNETIRFPDITYSFYPVYANIFNIPYEEITLDDNFTIEPSKYFNSDGGVIFPNPNAPTSIYLPLENIEEIVKNNKNKVVIIDEAYIDFAKTSAISLTKQYDNILIIQTMSKSRSLAGLRIGFAIGHENLITGLMRIKDSFNSYPVDQLALTAAQTAIEDDGYFQQIKNKIIKTRNWTVEQLKQLGFIVLPSSTNFVFISHPNVDASYIYEALRKKGILIRYFGKNKIKNYVRITIGTDENMEQLIKMLQVILDDTI